MAVQKGVKRRKDAALKAKRKRKKWFKLMAPSVYDNAEISEITAFDTKELIGRTIELSMRDLGKGRDQSQKVVFRISKVKGETAETEVIKAFLTDSSVQKKSRKIKEKLIHVFFLTLATGQKVKFKVMLNTNNHLHRSTKSNLINTLPKVIEDIVKKKSANDLFAPGYFSKLSLETKKQLKVIYPINNVNIWKISLVK